MKKPRKIHLDLDAVAQPRPTRRRPRGQPPAAVPHVAPVALPPSPAEPSHADDFNAGILEGAGASAGQAGAAGQIRIPDFDEIGRPEGEPQPQPSLMQVQVEAAPEEYESIGFPPMPAPPGTGDAESVEAKPTATSDFEADADASETLRTDRPGAAPAGVGGDERPRERRGRRRRGRGKRGKEAAVEPKEPGDVGTDVGDRELSVTREPELLVDEDEDEQIVAKEPPPSERREMLINVSDADECRIALMRGGRLDELYLERASAASNVGNIYKGRITNVESSIQAAFVDFGKPMHGFLHISDLHPQYFPDSTGEPELVGRKTPRRSRPPIQACLRRGQEVLVQVIKEGIGTKGPTLSTYISLPGRFLVMMPGMDELGVSRKIEDEEQRRKLRAALGELTLPAKMGYIVRTAGIDRNKRDLQRDLNYLARLWKRVEERIKGEPAPAELYKESDLVIRTIRDVFDSNIRSIVVDNAAVADRVREFLAIASPRAQDLVSVYDSAEPIFHRYGIEAEIEKLHSKHVPLACGGSLVIEQTEALVAIDVNSGRFRVHDSAEETAYRVNLEAVDEIARQLRLRDLGGLIICDFIDMMQERHRRQIERNLSEALRKHKERAKILRISRFGILEMTRQRQRPSISKSLFQDCPRCNGSGRVKAVESVSIDAMRLIRLAGQKEGVASIDVRLSPAVAADLLNRKRHTLTDLERAGGQTIRIHADESIGVDQVLVSCTDRRGHEVLTLPGVRESSPRLSAAPPARPRAPASGGVRSQAAPAGDSTGRRRGGRRRGARGGRRRHPGGASEAPAAG